MFCDSCGNENTVVGPHCSFCGAVLTERSGQLRVEHYQQLTGGNAPPSPQYQPYSPALPQQQWGGGAQGGSPVVDAGFWLRAVARLIDVGVLGIAGAILGCIVVVMVVFTTGIVGGIQKANVDDLSRVAAGVILLLVVPVTLPLVWLYFTLLESSAHMGTLGKQALGLIVTDQDGRRISFGQANGRFFGKVLSAMLCGIGFLMAAFTERKQALHDQLAGTYVVMR